MPYTSTIVVSVSGPIDYSQYPLINVTRFMVTAPLVTLRIPSEFPYDNRLAIKNAVPDTVPLADSDAVLQIGTANYVIARNSAAVVNYIDSSLGFLPDVTYEEGSSLPIIPALPPNTLAGNPTGATLNGYDPIFVGPGLRVIDSDTIVARPNTLFTTTTAGQTVDLRNTPLDELENIGVCAANTTLQLPYASPGPNNRQVVRIYVYRQSFSGTILEFYNSESVLSASGTLESKQVCVVNYREASVPTFHMYESQCSNTLAPILLANSLLGAAPSGTGYASIILGDNLTRTVNTLSSGPSMAANSLLGNTTGATTATQSNVTLGANLSMTGGVMSSGPDLPPQNVIGNSGGSTTKTQAPISLGTNLSISSSILNVVPILQRTQFLYSSFSDQGGTLVTENPASGITGTITGVGTVTLNFPFPVRGIVASPSISGGPPFCEVVATTTLGVVPNATVTLKTYNNGVLTSFGFFLLAWGIDI